MPQKIKNSNPVANGGAPEVVAGAAGPAPGDALVDEEEVEEVVQDVVDDEDEEDDKAEGDIIDICSFFELDNPEIPENGNK